MRRGVEPNTSMFGLEKFEMYIACKIIEQRYGTMESEFIKNKKHNHTGRVNEANTKTDKISTNNKEKNTTDKCSKTMQSEASGSTNLRLKDCDTKDNKQLATQTTKAIKTPFNNENQKINNKSSKTEQPKASTATKQLGLKVCDTKDNKQLATQNTKAIKTLFNNENQKVNNKASKTEQPKASTATNQLGLKVCDTKDNKQLATQTTKAIKTPFNNENQKINNKSSKTEQPKASTATKQLGLKVCDTKDNKQLATQTTKAIKTPFNNENQKINNKSSKTEQPKASTATKQLGLKVCDTKDNKQLATQNTKAIKTPANNENQKVNNKSSKTEQPKASTATNQLGLKVCDTKNNKQLATQNTKVVKTPANNENQKVNNKPLKTMQLKASAPTSQSELQNNNIKVKKVPVGNENSEPEHNCSKSVAECTQVSINSHASILEKSKILKKKLKKKRQRDRKKDEKVDAQENIKKPIKSSAEGAKDSAAAASGPLAKNTKITKQDDSTESEDTINGKESNQNDEIDFLNNIPAFISTALKKNNKKLINTLTKNMSEEPVAGEPKDSLEMYNAIDEEYINDQSDDETYTFVKGKRSKQQCSSSTQLIEISMNKAFELIVKNKLMPAIKYLSEIIKQDPTEIRCYINRSFCYMRLHKYSLAISDAQYVTQHSKNVNALRKAKYILARCFSGIQNFRSAEITLKECLELAPNNHGIRRELARIKVLQLMSFGFPEKDAIYSLKKGKTILKAIEVLEEQNTIIIEDTFCLNNHCCIYNDNDVYYSDDDDENCSNTFLLSTIE